MPILVVNKTKLVIVFISIFIVFVILLFLFYIQIRSRWLRYYEKKREDEQNIQIPRVIWTYWNTEELPRTIQICIDTWRYHNPTLKINILNRSNIGEYIDVDVYKFRHVKDETRASDFIRVCLLEKFGGLWMDSTIICTKPLDWVFDVRGKDFVGYYIEQFTTSKTHKVIENWFMACPKNSSIIEKLKLEFTHMNEFETVEKYIQCVKESGVDTQHIPYPEYLTMHIAFQKVLQKNKLFALELVNATGKNGPFLYLNENEWDSVKSLHMLCNFDRLKTPIIKLRGNERKLIDIGEASIDCFIPI